MGTRLEERTGNLKAYTLHDVLTNKDNLLFRYGIVIIGANSTSGFGKSAFCKALACAVSQCIAEAKRMTPDRARVIYTRTLEGLRDVEFHEGDTILLDEFQPGDSKSNVYISDTILKTFNDPSEVCTFRARNKDIVIPPGICRVTCGNGDDRKNYFGDTDSLPLQRKTITFFIKRPLVKSEWVQSLRNPMNITPEMNEVTELLANRMSSVSAVPSSPCSEGVVGCCGAS